MITERERQLLGWIAENPLISQQELAAKAGIEAGCRDFLVLGALGMANMWVAIFADVGVMVLAVLNAVRCLRAGK